MRNKFIKIEQRLQLIEKLSRSNNISYIARNFKKYNRENRSFRKQNNSSSTINNAKNSIILITKITITI